MPFTDWGCFSGKYKFHFDEILAHIFKLLASDSSEEFFRCDRHAIPGVFTRITQHKDLVGFK